LNAIKFIWKGNSSLRYKECALSLEKIQQKVIKVGSEISAETLMISRKQLINLPDVSSFINAPAWCDKIFYQQSQQENSIFSHDFLGGCRGQACEREQSNTFLLVFLKSAALDLVIFTHFSPHSETQGAHRPQQQQIINKSIFPLRMHYV